jgi:hypothetical protein
VWRAPVPSFVLTSSHHGQANAAGLSGNISKWREIIASHLGPIEPKSK